MKKDMMIEKEFVPYEEAVALKELGFDEKVMATYYRKKLGIIKNCLTDKPMPNLPYPKYVLAPTYQQAFRWFREKYKLFSEVNLTTKQEDVELFEFFVLNVNEPLFESDDYTVYEKAELACLRKLIEIVNQNKDE